MPFRQVPSVSKSNKSSMTFMQRFTALLFLVGFITGTFTPIGSMFISNASAQSITDITTINRDPTPLKVEEQKDPVKRTQPVTEDAKKTVLPIKDPVTESLEQDKIKTVDDKEAKPILSSELVDKRTAFSNTYINTEGGETVRLFNEQVNYQPKGKNSWQPVAATVKEDKNYNTIESNKESVLSQLLPGKPYIKKAILQEGGLVRGEYKPLGDEKGIKVSFDGSQSLNVQLDGANSQVNPTYAKNDDGSAYTKYENAWKNTDVYYEQRGSSLKEYILLKNKDTPSTFGFTFTGAKLSYGIDGKGKQDGTVVAILSDKTMIVLPQLSVASKVTGPMTSAKLKYEIKGNKVNVVVDKQWLNAQSASAYPLVIDPTYDWRGVSTGIPGGDYGQFIAYDSRGYRCNSNSCDIYAGTLNDGGAKVWRTMMRLPLADVYGKSVSWANIYTERVSRPYAWNGYNGNRPYEFTWANCFGFHCFSGAPRASGYLDWAANFDATSLMQWVSQNNVGDGWIMMKALNENDIQSYKSFSGSRTFLDVNYIHYNQQTAIPTLAEPVQNAVIPVSRPTLKINPVGDPDGDVVRYAFHLLNSKGNIVAHSGELDTTQWTIPDNVMVDGEVYSWRAFVQERNAGNQAVVESGWRQTETRSFTFDLRTGKDKSQTFDDIGPLSVSLNKGNGYTAAESHSISALGGSIGIGLNYNTPGLTRQGLTAAYYNGTDTNKTLAITVNDPNIDMIWGASSPYPGTVQADYFTVNWKGYFIAPENGTYVFGADKDDAMSMNLDGIQQLNQGCCGNAWSSTSIVLKKGQAYPIDVWYTEVSGYAAALLNVRMPNGTERRVPSEWLRTLPDVTLEDGQGLTARFYKNEEPATNPNFNINNKTPLVFTTKVPQLNQNWGEGSLVPYDIGEYKDQMIANYSGFITIPVTGEYQIGGGSDDGLRIRLGGKEITSRWLPQGYTETWSAPMQFQAGQVIPISVDYFEVSSVASANLQWKGPAGNGIIPGSYLGTVSKVAPRGWNVSADIDGAIPYETLQLKTSGNAELIDGDGFVHVYAWTGSGFKPPVNEDGHLVRNADSTFTLMDVDGAIYIFSADGVITSASSPQDEKKPAALKYEYVNTPINGFFTSPKLSKIVDPVDTSRYGQLYYWGTTEANGVCTVASGFDNPLPGYLCAFKTSVNSDVTKFFYKEGQLSRVEQPGNELIDYGYDTFGRVTKIRDVLSNDLLLAGLRNIDGLETEISYDGLYRINKVKAPAPFGTAPTGQSNVRMEHIFDYGFQTSTRNIAGINLPHGYQQYIEYDNLFRTTKSCNIQTLCSLIEWDPSKDLELSTTNEGGLKQTTIYNTNDLPVDSFGPAPSSWYGSDRRPLSQYANKVAHVQTAYDEGIIGPSVSWFDYKRSDGNEAGILFGSPKLSTTGLNTSSPGILSTDLTQAPITASAGMQGIGLRSTGKLYLPIGKYWINAATSEGIKIWVDDQLILDSWLDAPYRSLTGGSFTVSDSIPKKIRVDTYRKTGSTGAFSVSMKQDFGFDWTSDWNSWLKPDYNLSTSSKSYDDDGTTTLTRTDYGINPELGLAKTITEDAGGLNLSTTMEYETRGAGFFRQTNKTLPGGNTFTYTHYGANESQSNPCVPDSAAVSQAGFVKGKIEPDPDGVGSLTARRLESVYDASGRVVASRYNTDPWTCTTYDIRGRNTIVVIPSANGLAGRTVTNNYMVNGNPLISSSSDNRGTITTENDLLGRVIKYTDSKNNITNTFYDDKGRVYKRVSPIGTETYILDQYDRLIDQTLDGVIVAHVNYDSIGRITSVDYPSVAQQKVIYSYDELGRVNEQSYLVENGARVVSDSVIRNSNGDIISGSENGVPKNYTYDKAGRLTKAEIGIDSYEYAFITASTSTCTRTDTNLNAHLNGNRSSKKVNGVIVSYCYDRADRLTKSSDPNVGTISYDVHGNTTNIGMGTSTITKLGYDASDRNVSITEGLNKVTYIRDVQGRISNRTVMLNNVSTAYAYGFIGTEDTPDLLKDSSGAVLEKYIQLPGNVLMTVRPTASIVENKNILSLSNIHGDIFATTNGNGVLQGIFISGPFGEKAVHSSVLLNQSFLPENASASASFQYVGQHEKITEGFLTLTPIQMGARVYIPSLGRFTTVDPIEGGTDNSYVYVNDPVNDFDLTGQIGFKRWFKDRGNNVLSARNKVSNFAKRNPRVTDTAIILLTRRPKASKNTEGIFSKNSYQTLMANKLGYNNRIPPQKAPFPSRGQPVYQQGSKNRYITPDKDSHKGGVWKMVEMKNGHPKRLGTYDKNLKRIGD